MNGAWYILFDGVYVEGGDNNPKFIGRTTDEEEAKAHYIRTARNVLSIGYVIRVTDDSYKSVNFIDFNLPSDIVTPRF